MKGEVVSSFSILKRLRCLNDKRLEGLVSINCEEEMIESDTLLKIAFSDQVQTENPEKIYLN